jgi:DNA-binding transcriptional regulator YiaG
LLLVPQKIGQPVEVARLLTRYGMSLRKAHDTLNRLADRNIVAAELRTSDHRRLCSELLSLGVKAHVIHTPNVDVKRVREELGLSQAEFALRFGLELDTIQNWEQGRYKPDPAAQLLIKLIETHPEIVQSALIGSPPDALRIGKQRSD